MDTVYELGVYMYMHVYTWMRLWGEDTPTMYMYVRGTVHMLSTCGIVGWFHHALIVIVHVLAHSEVYCVCNNT